MLAGCAATPETAVDEPAPSAPPTELVAAVVAETPVPPSSSAKKRALAAPAPAAPAAPEAPPPTSLYRCLKRVQGEDTWNPIELAPKLEDLCRRHPEMGPCQYQRQICRRAGGRVFDSEGREITPRIEAEYDRKVLRLKFRS